MFGLEASLDEARAVAAAVDHHSPLVRIALCPPATLVQRMAAVLGGSSILVGGQDCRAEPEGAFTGDISAEMLADAGAEMVILGHSERRAHHRESDADVAAKVGAALRAGLEPIICVGETLELRQAGRTLAVVTEQVRASLPQSVAGRAFCVAYEPVWAIGSGLTPTLTEIEDVHGAIRETLAAHLGQGGTEAPILYGGSVKPANAGPILHIPEVAGALVGGASLKADDFIAIFRAL